MKKRKYLVCFESDMQHLDVSDNFYPIYAYHLTGACMEASELESKFEQMSKYVKDDKGNKYTFEINVITEKYKEDN